MEYKDIMVYAETDSDLRLRPAAIQLVSKAFELAKKLDGSRVIAAVIGKEGNYDEISALLSQAGADVVVIASDKKLITYNNSYYPEIFVRLVRKYMPKIVLTGATYSGKEIASYTATKLETGLTADCCELDITGDKNLLSIRPTFGGKLTAEILSKTYPQMATVQEHIFKTSVNPRNTEVIYESINVEEFENKTQILEIIQKERSTTDITKAEIIVAGGGGACTKEGFELVTALAAKLNAAVAGSREAYERGYITKSQQTGQTGKTVAPKLYIAVGISGAAQHIAGIKNSDKIIAINSDKNAPIFNQADLGIVGNLFDILPELINSL